LLPTAVDAGALSPRSLSPLRPALTRRRTAPRGGLGHGCWDMCEYHRLSEQARWSDASNHTRVSLGSGTAGGLERHMGCSMGSSMGALPASDGCWIWLPGPECPDWCASGSGIGAVNEYPHWDHDRVYHGPASESAPGLAETYHLASCLCRAHW